jgi:RNA polymerase sigma factor (sigma-70 family)
MEVSALKYAGGIGLHGRSSLLRLQSDDRLVAFVRRGNVAAFEALVGRYESRLLAFSRHMLGSREDAEDVLQEVFAAAFNALLADERPINVRPWLYRIARNRSLNHLRKAQAVASDSMDIHFSDHGASTADKAHEREEFRLLVGDIHLLPESQKSALVLREMDALSYEQIAEAMETTVPSVKSLLVRARVSLAEAAEARLLSCDEVRIELGEIAEGLRRRPTPLVRRHLKACERCSAFREQLRQTNKALAALLPIGPLVLLRKLVASHLGHSAGSHSGAGAAASGGAGTLGGAGGLGGAAAGGGTIGASGLATAGIGAIATKAAVGLAAAALVTAGAVEVDHSSSSPSRPANPTLAQVQHPAAPARASGGAAVVPHSALHAGVATTAGKQLKNGNPATSKSAAKRSAKSSAPHNLVASTTTTTPAATTTPTATTTTPTTAGTTSLPARTQTQTDPTVLSGPADTTASPAVSPVTTGTTPTAPTIAPVQPAPTGTTPGTGPGTTPTWLTAPPPPPSDGQPQLPQPQPPVDPFQSP